MARIVLLGPLLARIQRWRAAARSLRGSGPAGGADRCLGAAGFNRWRLAAAIVSELFPTYRELLLVADRHEQEVDSVGHGVHPNPRASHR